MSDELLDGRWRLQRLSGLLPPLRFMRKDISGGMGRTLVGRVPLRFDVDGQALRYRPPLAWLVDVLEREGADRIHGETFVLGRRVGSFRMIREPSGG